MLSEKLGYLGNGTIADRNGNGNGNGIECGQKGQEIDIVVSAGIFASKNQSWKKPFVIDDRLAIG